VVEQAVPFVGPADAEADFAPALAGASRGEGAAELVAEGLSNPAIAARVYPSRATVASHVATSWPGSGSARMLRWPPGRPHTS
jgi:hypothetical protein